MSEASEANKERLRTMFSEVFEASELDREAVERHFAPTYRQRVDGHWLDYGAFVGHLEALKREVASTEITIEHLLAEGDEVCSVHAVSATKRGGGRVEGQVMAHWRFSDGRIVGCKELTHMTAGSDEDRDLGSRT